MYHNAWLQTIQEGQTHWDDEGGHSKKSEKLCSKRHVCKYLLSSDKSLLMSLKSLFWLVHQLYQALAGRASLCICILNCDGIFNQDN